MKYIRGLGNVGEERSARLVEDVSPEELLSAEERIDYEIGVKGAPLLKKTILTPHQKTLGKFAIAILIAIALAIPALQSQLKLAQQLRHQAQVERQEGEKIEMRGKVSSFDREADAVYAVVEKKGQIYRVPIPKDVQKDITIGDEVDFTYRDGLVPKVTLEKILQQPRS